MKTVEEKDQCMRQLYRLLNHALECLNAAVQ